MIYILSICLEPNYNGGQNENISGILSPHITLLNFVLSTVSLSSVSIVSDLFLFCLGKRVDFSSRPPLLLGG